MVSVALRNRPEVLELLYKNRINQDETTAALLELLPGVQLYAGASFDSNDFLFNNNWLLGALKPAGISFGCSNILPENQLLMVKKT